MSDSGDPILENQIALSCSVGQARGSEYLKASEAAGVKWS
jgi:hypothetical protein